MGLALWAERSGRFDSVEGVTEYMYIKHGKADLLWLLVSVVPIYLVRYTDHSIRKRLLKYVSMFLIESNYSSRVIPISTPSTLDLAITRSDLF